MNTQQSSIKQQDRLRSVQRARGLTRDELARALGVSRRGLDKWFLPDNSKDHRLMPETVSRLLALLANPPTPDESGLIGRKKQ